MAQMELTGKKRGKSREMAIKYIFADVDGTLGIGGIGIPAKNRLAIRKYVEEGGSFGVCTGRSPDSVKGFIGDLPINTLSVVNGGCALYDFQKGEYLDELCVEEDALQFAFSMKKELKQFTECRIRLPASSKIATRSLCWSRSRSPGIGSFYAYRRRME